MHNYMDLTVESKGEGYEEYNPDWLFLRVVKYVEGMTYDFRNLDKLPWQIVRVEKSKDTVA